MSNQQNQMSSKKIFLRPKLEGKRFENHTLPVNIMEDFSVLEELIFDLAKKIYIDKNPLRKRVPNHFTDNVSLQLSKLEDGSVIPNFLLVALTSFSNPTFPTVTNNNFRYFEEARDKVFEIVEKANIGEASDLNPKFLNYFYRIGRNLKEGESIDFLNDSTSNRNVIFNNNTRRKILLSLSEKLQYTEIIQKVVLIPWVNKKTKKFQIEIEGSTFECDLHKDFQDTVLKALNGYDNKCYISLKGTGIFNEQMKLIHIDNIDSMDLLDPFDISVRLNELQKLEDNWYDGEQGRKLNANGLIEFESLFNNYYGENLPLPAIFPTLSGDLLLEWKKENISISLEVNLGGFDSTLFYFDMLDDDNDSELEINIREEKNWKKINGIVQKII